MDITLISQLSEALQEHTARYQELIDFLEDEKKYLLNLDLDGLLLVSKAKEKLAKIILASNEKLTEKIACAALMLGLPLDPPPTLAAIAMATPGPFGAKLSEMASTLARLKNLIVRENATAKHFVEHSLELVTESLNILSGANQLKGDGYSSDGKKEKTVKRGLPSKLSREV
ncbi:MAG: flagellar protein FlgN [Deltaproteobacteria bacterium]|jgi:flagellar biosynthesis/type III secretory pathway chaperone|nr:flagellar protein FlgN [Deltaproteobacteria bacterium]